MDQSETHYVRTDDGGELAYRTVGQGPVDLFWSFNHLSDVEAIFEYAPIRDYIAGLAEFSRVFIYDRRGMGRSSGERGDVETDLTDLRTLLHEAGAQRPYLVEAIVGTGGACVAAPDVGQVAADRVRFVGAARALVGLPYDSVGEVAADAHAVEPDEHRPAAGDGAVGRDHAAVLDRPVPRRQAAAVPAAGASEPTDRGRVPHLEEGQRVALRGCRPSRGGECQFA